MAEPSGSGPERHRGYRAIGDYALLSDCHGSALVAADGSIDWCCVQRFDARPVFARILDSQRGGFFRIAPARDADVSRRYLPGTMILETTFDTGRGRVRLLDFMALFPDRSGDDDSGGTGWPGAEDRLIRIARCEEGVVELCVEFVPRFDYGVTVPHLRRDARDRLAVFGGADALVLQGACALEIEEEGRATGRLELREGESARFVLSYQLPHDLHTVTMDPAEIDSRLERTRDFWERWSHRGTYEGRHRLAVERSALVLKALADVRTGSMVAAPTTSLPEHVGGVRNWDYRYSWLRDASFLMESLFLLGYRVEGERFMEWLHRTVAGVPEALQIMYGAGGERLLPEVELDHLEGYRGSSPVRVGNAAARQFQLDIYGDVLHAAWRFQQHGGEITDDLWTVLSALAEFVGENWEREDHGLWEVRSQPRHFVHSKVMAWVALDRATRIARARGSLRSATAWSALCGRIRETVLERGVRADGSAFKRAFDLDEPDAAALLFPLMGFIAADDPLAIGTREWVESELRQGDFLRRYRGEDGLPGGEGAFLVCSFWLVENLARSGERERAEALFERLLECRNDLGLLSEQVSPEDDRLLGNFPQALSHIGLINAAVTLEGQRPEGDPPA